MRFPAKNELKKTNLISDMFWSPLSNSLFILNLRDLYLGQVYNQSPSSHSTRSSLSLLRFGMHFAKLSLGQWLDRVQGQFVFHMNPVGPVLATRARISNTRQNWPTPWYLKHMAQQHTPHFHRFMCACYWYALHYNENISTRWTAVPLPLPSTWTDFIICLLRSDFVIHLCWVPDRCLLANF